MTVLEGEVPPGKAEELERSYGELVKKLDEGIVQTFLARKDNTWRITTFWESRQHIEAVRSKGTPGGVLVFRNVSVEPKLSVFEVRKHASAENDVS